LPRLVQKRRENPTMKVMDEEAQKVILESYLEENALFMLKSDRHTFLSKILSVSDDEVVVSSPIEDYPLPGMLVEMHFHDQWGWYSFRSTVTAPPDFDKPRISLSRPVSTERFIHRKYTRVAVNLEARYRPLGGTNYAAARVYDLSVGGALIQSEERFEPEGKMEIDFSLPNGEIAAVVAEPSREMLEEASDGPPFYMGCQFMGLTRETMQVIRDYVWQQLEAGLP
jgi:c-di-GMP-binding flagellar brake protein YcgR